MSGPVTPAVLRAEYDIILVQFTALAPVVEKIVAYAESPRERAETVTSLTFLAQKLAALAEALDPQ